MNRLQWITIIVFIIAGYQMIQKMGEAIALHLQWDLWFFWLVVVIIIFVIVIVSGTQDELQEAI